MYLLACRKVIYLLVVEKMLACWHAKKGIICLHAEKVCICWHTEKASICWHTEKVCLCWHAEKVLKGVYFFACRKDGFISGMQKQFLSVGTQRTCIASIKKTWVFGVHLLACKTEFIFWYAEKVFICLLFVGMKKRPVWFINLLVCRKGVYQEMALTSSQLTARSYIMMYLC